MPIPNRLQRGDASMLRSGFGYSVNKERVSGIPKASIHQRAATVVINGLNKPGANYPKRPIALMLSLCLYLLLSNSPRRNSELHHQRG